MASLATSFKRLTAPSSQTPAAGPSFHVAGPNTRPRRSLAGPHGPLAHAPQWTEHGVQLIDRQEHGDFERRPRGAHARRRALSPSRQRLGALLRVRPQLQDSRRRPRRVQGALQRRRAPDGAVGLCGRRAVRSDREEAVLSRASRARLRTASACSAAICTAATARTGSRRRRCAIRTRSRRRSTSRPSSSCAMRCARGAKIIVSTYNEPLITSEWAVAIFKEARAAGLMTGFVSNGNGTPRGARVSAAVDRCLQGRSEELRRPALSRARRPAAADPRHHSRLHDRVSGSRSSRC